MLSMTKPPEEQKATGIFSKFMKKVDGCDVELSFKGKEQKDMVQVDDRYVPHTHTPSLGSMPPLGF